MVSANLVCKHGVCITPVLEMILFKSKAFYYRSGVCIWQNRYTYVYTATHYTVNLIAYFSGANKYNDVFFFTIFRKNVISWQRFGISFSNLHKMFSIKWSIELSNYFLGGKSGCMSGTEVKLSDIIGLETWEKWCKAFYYRSGFDKMGIPTYTWQHKIQSI